MAYRYPLRIHFIEFMPVGDLLFWDDSKVISIKEVKRVLSEHYNLVPLHRLATDRLNVSRLEGGQGGIGFISPLSNHFCSKCNHIRLTAEGKLRNCLYDYHETDLKAALVKGISREELCQLLAQAISRKPERHHMQAGWGKANNRKMYQIGG